MRAAAPARLCAGLAAILTVLALPARAEPPVLALDYATCAALWEGTADILGDRGERELAARFLRAAGELMGEAEARAFAAERRPWMADLLHAYVEDADDQSRDLFERLVAKCGALAGDLP